MGCSASRPSTLVTKNQHHHHHHHHNHNNHSPENNNPCSSSSCSSYSCSLDSSCTFSSSSPKPVSRALSLPTPLVHHPPSRKGDTHHLVSLTSTTYGSLLLIDNSKVSSLNGQDCSYHHPPQSPPHINTNNKPQIATRTIPVESLSPDSVINTWELMDGLDDDIDFDSHLGNINNPISSIRKNADDNSSRGSVKPKDHTFVQDSRPSLTKPLWKHLSEESLLSKMDPDVASSYIRALSSRQLGYNHHQVRKASSLGSSPVTSSLSNEYLHLSGKKNQILIYFTSLRGIRKTYEDCCAVRMIFKSYRVAVDERDISMDSTYRKELQSLIGGKTISLPQVFIRGKHIGGAEEIKQLNEACELLKFLQGFPIINPTSVCESCGDARFVPCPSCCGSRKLFDEEEDQLRRCPRCNENGLIKCPSCCC